MTAISLQHCRAELEARIEELIELLDLLDGDSDFEPYLADANPADEDREGGDVQDERHDALDEGDDEPDLGWGIPRCGDLDIAEGWQPADSCLTLRTDEAYLDFNGDGYRVARELLRSGIKDKRLLARALDRTRLSVAYGGAF
ncbi:hypothetical protein QA646_17870 [Rhizobium sp. CB3090]|uniref:hypothetical protein n=1 Tax=Rhizobium sp. CB3090 TaxID=3039156 RepID=UPI0024B08F6D|nr:hypothetical protein [Rhizobium sp. CB3090]WFU09114.1 hypothetical protein QA646_17870 [Rhizobium sp. CB3090]